MVHVFIGSLQQLPSRPDLLSRVDSTFCVSVVGFNDMAAEVHMLRKRRFSKAMNFTMHLETLFPEHISLYSEDLLPIVSRSALTLGSMQLPRL